jgi:hypothetical protein
MYVVIKAFGDLQDPVKGRMVKEGFLPLSYRDYKPGDIFPHPAAPFPSQERFAELAGPNNKRGEPLIKWVEDPEPEQASDIPKEPVEPAEEAPEKTAPKRKTRTKKE